MLHTTRQQQKRKLTSALCQLEAILDEYFPELPRVFKNLLGKAASFILRNRPFPSDILEAGLQQLTEELKKASLGRVGKKRAEALVAAAQESIGVKEGLKRGQGKAHIMPG